MMSGPLLLSAKNAGGPDSAKLPRLREFRAMKGRLLKMTGEDG
jgi:hypothetical protein